MKQAIITVSIQAEKDASPARMLLFASRALAHQTHAQGLTGNEMTDDNMATVKCEAMNADGSDLALFTTAKTERTAL